MATTALRFWTLHRSTVVRGAALATALIFARASGAAHLKPETIDAWEQYIAAARAQETAQMTSAEPFFVVYKTPGTDARLKQGEVVVVPIGAEVPKHVSSGLIHHWAGAVFIPNGTVSEVLTVLRDYGRYKDIYHPAVVDSKAISSNPHKAATASTAPGGESASPPADSSGEIEDDFSMILMNKTVVAKTALDGDYHSSYIRVNDGRWCEVLDSTRIQEIAGYGHPSQHTLPKDQGTGLIWRSHSITRVEERDGGVLVEVEVIALSRDIPVAFRPVVSPVVRRVSREALVTSLQQTKDAVRSSVKVAAARSTTSAAF
jgi:hypothetical protein